MQNLLVALIVIASAAYAGWALMPRAWQARLLRLVFKREPVDAGGCGGCAGCAPAAGRAAPTQTSITVHRRQPR